MDIHGDVRFLPLQRGTEYRREVCVVIAGVTGGVVIDISQKRKALAGRF